MLRHGIVNEEGKVINIIVWDGVSPWNPPKGHIAIQHDSIDIGDLYDHMAKTLTKPDRKPK